MASTTITTKTTVTTTTITTTSTTQRHYWSTGCGNRSERNNKTPQCVQWRCEGYNAWQSHRGIFNKWTPTTIPRMPTSPPHTAHHTSFSSRHAHMDAAFYTLSLHLISSLLFQGNVWSDYWSVECRSLPTLLRGHAIVDRKNNTTNHSKLDSRKCEKCTISNCSGPK